VKGFNKSDDVDIGSVSGTMFFAEGINCLYLQGLSNHAEDRGCTLFDAIKQR
jgi:hypothetical protein